jgi:hypothetical protein
VTIAEVAHCARGYDPADLGEHMRVTHVPVRATTLAWSKEDLNIEPGSRHSFPQVRMGCEGHSCPSALPVAQPWKTAYDLGPNDDHLHAHVSFTSVFNAGKPIVPKGTKFWKYNGGPYDYPHSGFAWCWVREILDKIGGLFEAGGMGSGDHHMVLSLAGLSKYSFPAA